MRRFLAPVLLAFALAATALAAPGGGKSAPGGGQSGLLPTGRTRAPIGAAATHERGPRRAQQLKPLKSAAPRAPKGVKWKDVEPRLGRIYSLGPETEVGVEVKSVAATDKGLQVTLRFIPKGTAVNLVQPNGTKSETWGDGEGTYIVPKGKTTFYVGKLNGVHTQGVIARDGKGGATLKGLKVGLDQP